MSSAIPVISAMQDYFGYAKTDTSGKFEIHTVKPSGYPQSELPAHIHVEVPKHENYEPKSPNFFLMMMKD